MSAARRAGEWDAALPAGWLRVRLESVRGAGCYRKEAAEMEKNIVEHSQSATGDGGNITMQEVW